MPRPGCIAASQARPLHIDCCSFSEMTARDVPTVECLQQKEVIPRLRRRGHGTAGEMSGHPGPGRGRGSPTSLTSATSSELIERLLEGIPDPASPRPQSPRQTVTGPRTSHQPAASTWSAELRGHLQRHTPGPPSPSTASSRHTGWPDQQGTWASSPSAGSKLHGAVTLSASQSPHVLPPTTAEPKNDNATHGGKQRVTRKGLPRQKYPDVDFTQPPRREIRRFRRYPEIAEAPYSRAKGKSNNRKGQDHRSGQGGSGAP